VSSTCRACTRTGCGPRCRRTAERAGSARQAVAPRWVRSSDPDGRALQRLYPKAFSDDDDASAEFHDITHDELLEQRLAAIDTMERTLRFDHLTEDELLAWLAALNDVRLVLGVRLEVTEEASAADFAGDPEAERAYELYRYLSYLEEHVVDALSS
jgi:uncharacterized protein DUF2017